MLNEDIYAGIFIGLVYAEAQVPRQGEVFTIELPEVGWHPHDYDQVFDPHAFLEVATKLDDEAAINYVNITKLSSPILSTHYYEIHLRSTEGDYPPPDSMKYRAYIDSTEAS